MRFLGLLNAATNTYMFCLRCKESESPHAVTVYMLEPQTCQYILGVSGKQNVFEIWLQFWFLIFKMFWCYGLRDAAVWSFHVDNPYPGYYSATGWVARNMQDLGHCRWKWTSFNT